MGLSEDKVFVARLDGKLVALDRRTGVPAWTIDAERPEENFSFTAAPVYFDGLVITGPAGADRGTRGRVKAYDADDGRLVWTFYVIPGPGEPGHETWPQNNDSWKHGGGALWQTPAIDPELGLVYFSTANAGPDYNGAVRAGDNLYTASIVAIELKTGKYRWHFQQVHHDIWDYDSRIPSCSWISTSRAARAKQSSRSARRAGPTFSTAKRASPSSASTRRPVPQEPLQATAATQPYPRGDAVVPQEIEIAPEGRELVNQGRIFTPFAGEDPTIVKPGIWGGASWPPSSSTIPSNNTCSCARRRTPAGTPAAMIRISNRPSRRPVRHGADAGAGLPRGGIIAAMDMTTNKIVWRYRWAEQCYSGTLATGGDLLFVGRNDGRLTALDSRSGKQLWEFQTGAGMHAPTSTFMHRGKQYMLAYSSGSALIGSPRGDSVWLFGLEGTLPPAEPGVPVNRLAAAIPTAAACADRSSSARRRVASHGGQPERQTRVPGDLRDLPRRGWARRSRRWGALNNVPNAAAVVAIVAEGRNNMPAFSTLLTPVDIRDVAAYVAETLTQGQGN